MLSPQTIFSALPANTKTIFIAYSGGVDSHVLLHLLSSMPLFKQKVVAVYVHHGLQIEAEQWAVHCEVVALALGVDFKCLRVNVQKSTRQSQEEVAREARYQALKTLLTENDVLLLAQHREDQMETVLLQLFRGAGVQGLSGMPWVIGFGLGKMIRPFLDVSKQDINAYAALYQLQWVEDPSNQSDAFDRNFLRNQILPQLKQRWPAIDKTVARSARHCANSQALSQGVAVELFDNLYDKDNKTLNITGLLLLNASRQQLVIRQWFSCHQLRMPSEKIVQRILSEVVSAKKSASPEVKVKDSYVQRYRDKLYCLQHTDVEFAEQCWPAGVGQLEYKPGCFLKIVESSAGIDKALWDTAEVSIRFRRGAEKIRLPGRQGRHSLKKLFQEQGIPPWERKKIPLIYLNDKLAAVGDLWVDSDVYRLENKACYTVNTVKTGGMAD